MIVGYSFWFASPFQVIACEKCDEFAILVNKSDAVLQKSVDSFEKVKND